MSAGMGFTMGCLACEGELSLINSGPESRLCRKVVVRCMDCKREYLIVANIYAISEQGRRRDGLPKGRTKATP